MSAKICFIAFSWDSHKDNGRVLLHRQLEADQVLLQGSSDSTYQLSLKLILQLSTLEIYPKKSDEFPEPL
ncbi:hypothetical protein MICAK_2860007 [Microcystis aeruginosa PCC 9701]|uniref:Uncharacterized protein n=1 Tax=Microcystis aeruginosa PCC 9701 TaxID=721123 RepID=I4IRR4_MICAE|nr:hypothetical protein MICAK_2860007 [Microcystis aeruginosa PCC 9701]